MAQLNITLSQEELLSFFAWNFDEKLKLIHTTLLNAILMAESIEQIKADSYFTLSWILFSKIFTF